MCDVRSGTLDLSAAGTISDSRFAATTGGGTVSDATLDNRTVAFAMPLLVFAGMDRTRFNIGTYRFGDKMPGFRTEQHVKELKEAGLDSGIIRL